MSIESLRKTTRLSVNKIAKAPFGPNGASTLCNLALFYLSRYPWQEAEIGVANVCTYMNSQVGIINLHGFVYIIIETQKNKKLMG
jgi:hypothetical protein